MRDEFYLPRNLNETRIMVFVDGENLAIRFGSQLGDRQIPTHVGFEKDVYVWSKFLNRVGDPPVHIIRRYYYTSVKGDSTRQDAVYDSLGELGIEAPRVFHKSRTKGSKRVDISLATEMLSHAHRRNYDMAVLVAGDEDYVPLVDAVAREGARVALWFLRDGLSPALLRAVDHYFDISNVLMAQSPASMQRREIDYRYG